MFAGAATAAERPTALVACTVVVDQASGAVLVREGTCGERFAPMSTFKVPLAAMGFDAGILRGAHDPIWPIMPEYGPSEREMAFPEVDPTSWEKNSIVWFSQHLTTLLGAPAFARYVAAFDYGNADVSGGLTRAWLMSSLRISPDEQVAFLRRLLAHQLPVSAEAADLTEEIIPVFTAGDWTVRGKTGAGLLPDAPGANGQSRPLGWFVGWADRDGRRVVFARLLVAAGKVDGPVSFIVRDTLLEDLPMLLAD
jgi:beta-lactamase class D